MKDCCRSWGEGGNQMMLTGGGEVQVALSRARMLTLRAGRVS